MEQGTNATSVGFVGLGSMGSAVVERLLDAGFTVTGWNRSAGKAEPLVERGMRRAETPAAVAAEADVVLSMVTDTAAVEEVASGDDGILAGLRPGSVWADMSTIAPDASRRLAERAAEGGAAMLDAPVSGSVATLKAGDLAIMAGGTEDAFRQAEPVFLAIGPRVTRVGENGMALVTKVALNLALVVQVVGFCEGVALAEKGGVSREAAVEAMLGSVISSPVLRYRGPFVLEGNMPDVAWADVDLQQKDLMLALDLGRRMGAPLPTAAAANELLNACRGHGHRPPRLRGGPPGLPAHGGSRVMKPFRTSIDEVPLESGLRREEGWIDMQVQFLIDERGAGTDELVVGRTVLPPGARHERHRHPHCDEFLVVMSGSGEIYTNEGEEPSGAGDVVFTPAGNWHGFNNTSDEDVLLIWGWRGAGSLEAAGYELPD